MGVFSYHKQVFSFHPTKAFEMAGLPYGKPLLDTQLRSSSDHGSLVPLPRSCCDCSNTLEQKSKDPWAGRALQWSSTSSLCRRHAGCLLIGKLGGDRRPPGLFSLRASLARSSPPAPRSPLSSQVSIRVRLTVHSTARS